MILFPDELAALKSAGFHLDQNTTPEQLEQMTEKLVNDHINLPVA